MDLIIARNEEELAELSGLEESSGFYSDFDKILAITYENKEAILERKETPLYFFQKSILHEYTHYMFARMVNDWNISYPAWFQEGISEYVGEDQTTVDYSGFRSVPFAELDTLEQWHNVRLQEETDVYAQSYFAIKYLIDQHGNEILKEIIDETNSSEDFEQGFMQATHMTVFDFENHFLYAYEMLR